MSDRGIHGADKGMESVAHNETLGNLVLNMTIYELATRAKGTTLATVAFSLADGTINEIVPYPITAIGF